MYIYRVHTGSAQDVLDPAYRTFDCDDEEHIIDLVKHIRALWTQQSSSDPERSGDASGTVIQPQIQSPQGDDAEKTEVGDSGARSDPASSNIEGDKWEALNHLFTDLMSCLPYANCSIGHLHPPAYSVFEVPVPGKRGAVDDGDAELVIKKHETVNIVLIPVFLAKGFKVKMVIDTDGSPEVLMDADAKNGTEMIYLRKDVQLSFFVEPTEESERPTEGVAAIMAMARLCTESHGLEHQCDLHKDWERVARTAQGMKGHPVSSYGRTRCGQPCAPGGWYVDEDGKEFYEYGAECGATRTVIERMEDEKETTKNEAVAEKEGVTKNDEVK